MGNEEQCNSHACVGDEVCIAKVDIVLLIDGSGPLTNRGFKVLQNFSEKVVDRFKKESYGHEAVNVGIVQFGNGHLGNDDIVSAAKLVQPLQDDLAATKAAIRTMTWQKGFTNMAQGLVKANEVLEQSMRRAPGVVVMITDGKPSFERQTQFAVEKLKKKMNLVVLQVKEFPSRKDLDLMKKYASSPTVSNYMHIPGKKSLKASYAKYVDDAVVKLCPKAESPMLVRKKDK